MSFKGGAMAVFPEYERYDGLGLAELVRNGEVCPAELVETVLDRIERRNGPINAVIGGWTNRPANKQRPPFPPARSAACRR